MQTSLSTADRRGFICAGCWTVDRIKLIDQWPTEESLARILGVDRQGGGSAHNVGIDLRRLDSTMPVSTIGMVGHDEDGDFLLKLAQAHELDTSQLHRTDLAATSYTDVMSVVGSGRRTFFHHPGTNDLLGPEHFDFSQDTARILHLGLLSVHVRMDATTAAGSNGWADVLKLAKAQGLETSIELVSIEAERNRELVLPCLPYLDYLVVNDQEIGSIAGINTVQNNQTQEEPCAAAAKKVLQMGSMQLVAVHYPGGAVCVTRDGQQVHMPSLPLPPDHIVGSVGAGDAFAAGFLYAMHEHWTVSEALALAHAVAAASLRSATTVDAVESVEQCQLLARRLESLRSTPAP